jgi:hypothetical protein
MSNNEDFDEDLELEIEIEEPVPSQGRKSVTQKVPTGTNVKLFFRSTIGPGEKLEKLSVNVGTPIVELKETVGKIFGLDPSDFNLSVGARTADPDDILENYEIEDGMEILVIPVSTAG